MNRSRQKKKKSSNQSRKILKQKKSRNIRKKSAKNKHSTNLLFKTVKLYEKQKHKYLDKHYKKIKQIGGAPTLDTSIPTPIVNPPAAPPMRILLKTGDKVVVTDPTTNTSYNGTIVDGNLMDKEWNVKKEDGTIMQDVNEDNIQLVTEPDTLESKDVTLDDADADTKKVSTEPKEGTADTKKVSTEPTEGSADAKDVSTEPKKGSDDAKVVSAEPKEETAVPKDVSAEPKEEPVVAKEVSAEPKEEAADDKIDEKIETEQREHKPGNTTDTESDTESEMKSDEESEMKSDEEKDLQRRNYAGQELIIKKLMRDLKHNGVSNLINTYDNAKTMYSYKIYSFDDLSRYNDSAIDKLTSDMDLSFTEIDKLKNLIKKYKNKSKQTSSSDSSSSSSSSSGSSGSSGSIGSSKSVKELLLEIDELKTKLSNVQSAMDDIQSLKGERVCFNTTTPDVTKGKGKNKKTEKGTTVNICVGTKKSVENWAKSVAKGKGKDTIITGNELDINATTKQKK